MKLFASAIAVALLFVAVQDVQAFNPQGGNALWGKYAIQTCRSCHKDLGLTGLDPMERSAEKWESFFTNDYQKLRDLSHDFAGVGINDRQLENIHRYLVETVKEEVQEQQFSPAETVAVAISPSRKKTVTTPSAKTETTPPPKKRTVASKKSSGDKFDMNAGNAGKGRYIFRKCLSCHKKTDAPMISPGDRTKKAWDRYFARDFRKFKRAMPDFDSYKFSVAQMEHLHQFTLKYALDAAQPKTCE